MTETARVIQYPRQRHDIIIEGSNTKQGLHHSIEALIERLES
jgi:hypothetical protein